MLDKGMSIITFERLNAANESTIRPVDKHKNETRESAKSSVPSSTKIPCASHVTPYSQTWKTPYVYG